MKVYAVLTFYANCTTKLIAKKKWVKTQRPRILYAIHKELSHFLKHV